MADDGPTSWVAASEAAAENTDSDSELGEEPELLDDEAGKIHEVADYKVKSSAFGRILFFRVLLTSDFSRGLQV